MSDTFASFEAVYWMDGWAGRTATRCLVIGETPKRYRVKLESKSKLPGRYRWGSEGEIVLMPKQSIERVCP